MKIKNIWIKSVDLSKLEKVKICETYNFLWIVDFKEWFAIFKKQD